MRHEWSRGLFLSVCLGGLAGCEVAQLPEAVFKCELNGTCAQPGYVCEGDRVCRPARDAGSDAGFDAGFDAGPVDAGFDAGPEDAGFDAGPEDAGFDAGPEDAGFDAGPEDAGFDAGPEDAGFDAGPEDAGFDAGTDAGCVPTGAIDEPDPSGLDLDCDGFDGDLTRAVFVDTLNGLDLNAGTQAAPVQTFAHAATLGKEQIYLSTGTFTGDVTLATAAAVYGGYTPGAAWTRTTTRSLMLGSLLANPADAGRVVLELLEVQAPAATGTGQASVAVALRNASSASRITDCRFVGGTGSNGADGTDAPPVSGGNPGGPGGSGGDGGTGGAGADCGDAGTTAPGFAGGGSGPDGIGLPGADTALGGAGAAETYCDGGPCEGFDGGAALASAAGSPSSARPADPPAGSLGTLVGGQWTGVNLGTWAPAQSGQPGGGGGGGGGLLDLLGALLARGGGAGAGGSGGCGGRSGTAGQMGGASIALVLFDSAPTLMNVELVTTQAGRGGNGGAAGSGGAGGAAGAGAAGEAVAAGVAGAGGSGAAGGNGGAGRQGPGGWGGPVVGVFCGGSSAPVTDTTTTWTPGAVGLAGVGDPNGMAGSQPVSGYKANCP